MLDLRSKKNGNIKTELLAKWFYFSWTIENLLPQYYNAPFPCKKWLLDIINLLEIAIFILLWILSNFKKGFSYVKNFCYATSMFLFQLSWLEILIT